MNEFLTVADVASELRVSRPFVKCLIHRGELTATKAADQRGTPWLVERQVLERWVQSRYGVTREWVEGNPRGGSAMWSHEDGGRQR